MNAAPELEQFLRLDAGERYRIAIGTLGGAIARLAEGYEANPAEREDLIQDIHLQLWRSLRRFDGRCSLRTWVYRVAHNVAADHVARARRRSDTIDIDDLDERSLSEDAASPEERAAQRLTLESLLDLVRRLKPIDRQMALLYLEGEETAAIAQVTGLSTGATATRLHRIRALLAERLNEGRSR